MFRTLRTLSVLAILAAVVATSLGAAASLNVFGGAVQAGSDGTLVCDSSGISVSSWGVNHETGEVTFVQVEGVNDSNCAGNRLFGRVEDSSGIMIGFTTLLNPATGGAYSYVYPVAATISTAPTADGYDPHRGVGSYKLQLSNTTGHHGVSAGSIEKVVFWIEGGSGS